MKSLEEVQAERARLAAKYEPLISEARAELDAAVAEFDQARERRNAAVTAHKRLVDQFEDARVNVGKV